MAILEEGYKDAMDVLDYPNRYRPCLYRIGEIAAAVF
jgi:hypothetical protein